MSEANLFPLPEAFVKRMEAQLGSEAAAYFAALEEPYFRGLRLNSRKQPDDSAAIDGIGEPIPWNAANGRYLSVESTAGLSPLHEAGAYYIQEPSAMAPVAILAPKPEENVLDLCAAPGGKSTQIADCLQGDGLLVCNEPVPGRAKILSRNIERMGVCNALVVSADPDKLKGPWEGIFDAILVDAPCSGEGMFRRHPETRAEWNDQSPEGCASRQKRILEAAWQMLRPGGRLCYSTCTLNTIENEGVVRHMLDSFPDAETVSFSLPNADGQSLAAPEGMLHLYPHQLKGEGHFVALFHKTGESDAPVFRPAAQELSPVSKEQQVAYAAFSASAKAKLPSANALFGDVLLHCPPLPPLRSIKVLRAGLQLGAMKGKLFFPDHALAAAALPDCNFPSFETDSAGAENYLRGETLPCPENLSGFVLVKYAGLSLGFGKASGGQVKNHYPKGLRRP